MTDTVPLSPCDPAQCIPYQSIRYINGYAESYVHQFARDYAAAVSAADNAALQQSCNQLRAMLSAAIGHAESARKRVEELEAASQWRPIETAPKDGTEILLTNGVVVAQGNWLYAAPSIRERRDVDGRYVDQDESDGYDGWIDFSGGMQPDPTHWMPLPSQPKEPK